MNTVLYTNDVVILLSQIVSGLNKQTPWAHYWQEAELQTNFLNVKIVIFGGCPRTFNQFINRPIQVVAVILGNIEYKRHRGDCVSKYFCSKSGIPWVLKGVFFVVFFLFFFLFLVLCVCVCVCMVVYLKQASGYNCFKLFSREFLSWHSGNESDWEPWGCGFSPQPHSVG